MAQSFDWSSNRRVIAARRLLEGCFAIRRTGTGTSCAQATTLSLMPDRFVTRGFVVRREPAGTTQADRKSTRLNSSHSQISYAVFCLKKKKLFHPNVPTTDRSVPRAEPLR